MLNPSSDIAGNVGSGSSVFGFSNQRVVGMSGIKKYQLVMFKLTATSPNPIMPDSAS